MEGPEGSRPERSQEQDEEVLRCRYFEGLFSPHIQGELEAPERQALAEHIRACEDCSQRFGLSWRAHAGGGQEDPRRRAFRTKPKRRSRSTQRRFLWFLCFVSLAGLLLLAAAGFLKNGGMSPLRQGKKPVGLQVDESLAELLSLQTRLLAALVEPAREPGQRIPHAIAGEIRDFVEAWNAEHPLEADRLGLYQASLHGLFRGLDLAPGGPEWDRSAYLESLLPAKPAMVLISIDHASASTATCTLSLGSRAARAVFVRESRPGTSPAPGQRQDPLRLTWLALLP